MGPWESRDGQQRIPVSHFQQRLPIDAKQLHFRPHLFFSEAYVRAFRKTWRMGFPRPHLGYMVHNHGDHKSSAKDRVVLFPLTKWPNFKDYKWELLTTYVKWDDPLKYSPHFQVDPTSNTSKSH